jgi:hypothetical protein
MTKKEVWFLSDQKESKYFLWPKRIFPLTYGIKQGVDRGTHMLEYYLCHAASVLLLEVNLPMSREDLPNIVKPHPWGQHEQASCKIKLT